MKWSEDVRRVRHIVASTVEYVIVPFLQMKLFYYRGQSLIKIEKLMMSDKIVCSLGTNLNSS